MKVVTEISIIIQKGELPDFIRGLYDKKCEIQNLKIVEDKKTEELLAIEIIYHDRAAFKELIAAISKQKEKYRILSILNTLEKNIEGGLLQVCGKMPLDNLNDYEMNLIGATDLIFEKISENAGAKYISIYKSVALINCINFEEEIDEVFLQKAYAKSEADAILINRFTGMNAYPLAVTFHHIEDFIKTLTRIEHSFALIKINDIDVYDISIYENFYSDLTVPVISKWFDDVPLCLLAMINKLMAKNKLKFNETNIGFIGLEIGALRLTRLLVKKGVTRVLGNDINERLMLDFENQGGLGTTNENIFSNADLIIIFKKSYTEAEMQKLRPGQFIISLIKEDEIDLEIVINKGIRECISFNKSHTMAVFPGLIKGLLHSEKRHFSDEMIIAGAREIEKIMLDNYTFPDVFSNIHDAIADIIVPIE